MKEEKEILPAWFFKSGDMAYREDAQLRGKKFRSPFLDRTLKAMAGLISGFVFCEEYSQKPGMLQGLDPRFKLLGILSLVICVSLLHSLKILYGLWLVGLFLALSSRIDPFYFIRRAWLILPFFAGIIALPSAFNVFTPGEALWKIYDFGGPQEIGPYSLPADIALTKEGILSASRLVGRVGASISFVLLLGLTTAWGSLLKAVRSLGIPQVYVQTLGMTLRYLMLLAKSVEEMYLAKKSRTIYRRKARTEQRWAAGQMGTLFNRSMHLSSEVHRAMMARGYRGEVRILSVFRARKRDYGWLISCLFLTGILIYWDW